MANEVKDDWPQQLVMSMGTLFLLAGLGVDIALFSQRLNEGRNRKALPRKPEENALAHEAAKHPGGLSLMVGLSLLLVGYLLPRKRAL